MPSDGDTQESGSQRQGFPPLKEFWEAYVPGRSPREFMDVYDPFREREPYDVVRRYLDAQPHVFGIPRRERSWKKTFESYSYHMEEVIHALTAYLEETRPEWETPAQAQTPAAPAEEKTESEDASGDQQAPDSAGENSPDQIS